MTLTAVRGLPVRRVPARLGGGARAHERATRSCSTPPTRCASSARAPTSRSRSPAGAARSTPARATCPAARSSCCPVENSAEGTIAFSEFPAVWGGREVGASGSASRAAGSSTPRRTARRTSCSDARHRRGRAAHRRARHRLQPRHHAVDGNVYFDEKIDGTVHLALGFGFADLGGTNESAIHWDIVKDLRAAGGSSSTAGSSRRTGCGWYDGPPAAGLAERREGRRLADVRRRRRVRRARRRTRVRPPADDALGGSLRCHARHAAHPRAAGRARHPGHVLRPGLDGRAPHGLVASIVTAGHEIGHHGYLHLRTDKVGRDEQRDEIERGLAALEAAGAPRPVGYRSTAWEMTPRRSTCWSSTASPTTRAAWATTGRTCSRGRTADPRAAGALVARRLAALRLVDRPRRQRRATRTSCWLVDGRVRARPRRGRHVTFTMHPEVIGRGIPVRRLRALVELMLADGDVWFAPLDEVAAHVGQTPLDPQ